MIGLEAPDDLSAATSGRFPQPRWVWSLSAPLRHAGLAGAIAGLVAAGIGSRLAMRLIAVVDGDSEGVGTDASATVGDVSLGGTFGLLVIGAVLGIAGGLVYLGLRRWLFVPRAWRGVTYGALTLLTIGNVLFDTANSDFQIFEPILLVIGLFAMLFLVNGVLVVALVERLHPEPSYVVGRRVPWLAAGAIGAIAIVGATGLAESFGRMIDDAGTCISVTDAGEGCGVLATDVE